MFFYNYFWRFFFIFCFFIGIIIITDNRQSLSDLRIFIFGFTPILFSIIALIIRKNETLVVITSNIILLLVFTISLFEINLIKNNLSNVNSQNNKKDISTPQYCGASFLKTKNLRIYPLGGIANKKMVFQNAENKKIDIKMSDRYGFNNLDTIWDQENIHTIFLGDSFTYGADVNSDENISEFYRKKFKKTLNLGCEGSGPIIQLGIFKEYIKKLDLKPKYIIWNYYSGNDLTKNINIEKKSMYKNYLNKDFYQDLTDQQFVVNKIIKNFINSEKSKQDNINYEFNYKAYFNFFKFVNLRSELGFTHAFNKEDLKLFLKILNNVNDDVKSWGGKLIVITIPSQNRYKNIVSYLDEFFYDKKIFEEFKNNEIYFINIDKIFKESSNPNEYYSGHLNKRGNKVVSDILIKNIVKN